MGRKTLRLSTIFLFSAVLGLVFATGAIPSASAASTDCSLGYWKNHTDVWPVPYTPGDSFNFVFFDQGPNVTLLEALNLKGGGENALARQAVAALLDAARDMDFEPSEIQIRTSVSEAFESDEPEIINNLKNDLENAIIACETEDKPKKVKKSKK